MVERYPETLTALESERKSWKSSFKIPRKQIWYAGVLLIVCLIYFYGKELNWWVYVLIVLILLVLANYGEERIVPLLSYGEALVLLKREIDLDRKQEIPELPDGKISYGKTGRMKWDIEMDKPKWVILFMVRSNDGLPHKYYATVWARIGDVGFGGWISDDITGIGKKLLYEPDFKEQKYEK